MSNDPYSSPSSPIQNVVSHGSTGGVSRGVMDQLARTKPWVRLFSVVMFVGAGFMMLAAVGMLLVGGLGATSGKGSAAALPAAMGIGLAVLYGAMAIVYIFPAMKLWKYASSIARLLMSGSEHDLENALNEQRSFWKFVGVLVIIMIALYAIGFIVMMVFAVGMSSGMKPTIH